jgi:lipase maturation factor 1
MTGAHRRGPEPAFLWARWIVLRALGAIFFSAFYSLAFQIHGLIGTRGILPVAEYLVRVTRMIPGPAHAYYVPTLLWLGAGDRALSIIVGAGLVVSLLLALNVWPRLTAGACTLLFLSCVAGLQVFSAYQSDGMLLEAGFVSMFVAPRGLRPGLGATDPPTRWARLMLLWEWFRIYFGSGVVKLASGDIQWRTLTAMDHYYENNPLPTWVGWYAQQLPHAVHAAVTLAILVLELVVPWMMFLPRRVRIACFCIVTPLQITIILTANYAFLNYLVVALGVLLLDDRVFAWCGLDVPSASPRPTTPWSWLRVGVLACLFYASVAGELFAAAPLGWPARAVAPLRIADPYGLFAVMTTARYEIEFQGSRDGRTWTPYPFRYKPQDPAVPPGIYAPYQPRFDWNLWFASLDDPADNPWVVLAQARLLDNDPAVLALFAGNPFAGAPPSQVRTVRWQYWFTTWSERRRTGLWWRRQLLGAYAGTVLRDSSGVAMLVAPPPADSEGAAPQ